MIRKGEGLLSPVGRLSGKESEDEPNRSSQVLGQRMDAFEGE